MEYKELNFKKNPVETLTLTELKSTINEVNLGQKPMNGVQHFELLEEITKRLDNSDLEYSIENIYAADGGPKSSPGVAKIPMVEESKGENHIESYLLRRLLCKIIITTEATKAVTTALAVAFHQDGIQIALGPHITTCSNFCILGEGTRMQTYGAKKVKLNDMYTMLDGWIKNYSTIRAEQMDILKNMKKIKLTHNDVATLTGHFNFMRVGRDSLRINTEYPLTQGQISVFAENYLTKYIDLRKENQDPVMSLYDIYNIATNMHKPGETTIDKIIGNNSVIGNILIEKFNLTGSTATN